MKKYLMLSLAEDGQSLKNEKYEKCSNTNNI